MTLGLPAQDSTHTCHRHAAAVAGTAAACSRQGHSSTHVRAHTHTQMTPVFPTSPDRTPDLQPLSSMAMVGGLPGGTSGEIPLPAPTPLLPIPIPGCAQGKPREGGGGCRWDRSLTKPSRAETRVARCSSWTVRGMGWACSLTQPALRTTAQLDRAATCRWAGESNEKEC